jgi:hypothetical protein
LATGGTKGEVNRVFSEEKKLPNIFPNTSLRLGGGGGKKIFYPKFLHTPHWFWSLAT